MKKSSKRLASDQSVLKEARINVGKRKSQENRKVLRRLSTDQGVSTVQEELAIACSIICPTIETRRKNSGALHTRAVSAQGRLFSLLTWSKCWVGTVDSLEKFRVVCPTWLVNTFLKRGGLMVWMEGCPVWGELVFSLHSLLKMAGNGQHWSVDGSVPLLFISPCYNNGIK